jgi:hypothetical protein
MPRILIADDSEATRQALRNLRKETGGACVERPKMAAQRLKRRPFSSPTW